MKAFIDINVVKNFLDRIEGEWIIEAHITLEDASLCDLQNFPELPAWYSLDEAKKQPWLKEAKEFAAKYGCKHLYEIKVNASDAVKKLLGVGPKKQYVAVYGPTNCEYAFKARNARWAKAFCFANIKSDDVMIYEELCGRRDFIAGLDCPGRAISSEADIVAIDPKWSYDDYSLELLTL